MAAVEEKRVAGGGGLVGNLASAAAVADTVLARARARVAAPSVPAPARSLTLRRSAAS